MSDDTLKTALLNLDAVALAGAVSTPDTREQTRRIVARDSRRVTWLTWAAAGVWIVAGLLILSGMIQYGLLMPRDAKVKMDLDAGTLTPKDAASLADEIAISYKMLAVQMTFSSGVMCAAALLTVLLIRLSHRSDLRRIAASLAEIAAQLPKRS